MVPGRRFSRFDELSGAAAAKPIAVVNRNSSTSVSGTSHAVDLPASLVSGNLLVFAICQSNGRDFSVPSGWTQLSENQQSGKVTLFVCYKQSDGSEGSSVTATCSGDGSACHRTWQIENWQGTPEASTSSLGTLDPPSITPTWGATESLFLPVVAIHNEGTAADGAPTNYDNFLRLEQAPNRAAGWFAERITTTTTENPGTFQSGTVDEWVVSTTTAVQGA